MAQPSRIEPSIEPDRAVERDEANERARELMRRIEELEALEESALGPFTHWDWLACALLALVLPVAALVWFGR